jgi:signal peptidase I
MENREHTPKEEALEELLRQIREPAEENDGAGQESPTERSDGKTSQQTPQKDKKTKNAPKSGVLADLAALLLRIGWIAFIFAVLLLVVCGVTVNRGERMEPAFHDRDVVIYYRLAKDIQAGEVVVFRGENDVPLVGRVVAKAGDTVDIDETGLKINGYYQSEPYRKGDTVLFEGGAALPVTLRPGEFFILCDDRSQSSDSRVYGPISADRVLGRVMLSIRQRDF